MGANCNILHQFNNLLTEEQLKVVLTEMQQIKGITPKIATDYIKMLSFYYNRIQNMPEMKECYSHFFKIIKSDLKSINLLLYYDDFDFDGYNIKEDNNAMRECINLMKNLLDEKKIDEAIKLLGSFSDNSLFISKKFKQEIVELLSNNPNFFNGIISKIDIKIEEIYNDKNQEHINSFIKYMEFFNQEEKEKIFNNIDPYYQQYNLSSY